MSGGEAEGEGDGARHRRVFRSYKTRLISGLSACCSTAFNAFGLSISVEAFHQEKKEGMEKERQMARHYIPVSNLHPGFGFTLHPGFFCIASRFYITPGCDRS
jgi:hypothetical protein